MRRTCEQRPMFRHTSVHFGSLLLFTLTVAACPDPPTTADSSNGETSTGDGDGDPVTGDGDGDLSTGDIPIGDGDGDLPPGDGDGDVTTGDGDGEITTGDGDGDPATGDGDGDIGDGLCEFIDELCDTNLEQPEGWFCLDIDENQVGECRALCDAPGFGQPDPCGPNSVCLQFANTPSFCAINDCTGLLDNDCPNDLKCLPIVPEVNLCVVPGNAAAGDACPGLGGCDANSICNPFGFCIAPDCVPSGDDCANGEICSSFVAAGEALDIGVCAESCEPFADPDTCGAESGCVPLILDGFEGACEPAGFVDEGGFCTNLSPETTCQAGLTCGADNSCYRLCRPGELNGPGDTCSGQQNCSVPEYQTLEGPSVGWDFGLCTPN